MLDTLVLLATDEVSVIPDYARQLFDRDDWLGGEPAPVTRSVREQLAARGIRSDFATLEELATSAVARSRLGRTYHAACLLTVRVWQLGKTLRTPIEALRQADEATVFPGGARVRCLPAVIANPMNLLTSAKKYDEHLAWLDRADWVYRQEGDEHLADTLTRGLERQFLH